MRISARCDYACKALLELALHWPDNEPLHIKAISKNQNIPMRYLVQILIQLKRLGLVKSVRGKEGGYNIAKPLSEITLGMVVRSMSGELLSLAGPAMDKGSVFKPIWQEVGIVMAEVLDRITFEDILAKAEGADRILNYQI